MRRKKERKFWECKRGGTWWISGSQTESVQVPRHQVGSAKRGGLRRSLWKVKKCMWYAQDTTNDKCEVYIRVQTSLMQSESYFAFFKTFTSFSTECLVSKQWNIQQLLLLNVSWIYTSDAAQTAFLKIISKQCFLNSQCYVKRHNIFSFTKYQLSSPHSLPLIYWR